MTQRELDVLSIINRNGWDNSIWGITPNFSSMGSNEWFDCQTRTTLDGVYLYVYVNTDEKEWDTDIQKLYKLEPTVILVRCDDPWDILLWHLSELLIPEW